MAISRKEFLGSLVKATGLLAVGGAVLAACGDSDTKPDAAKTIDAKPADAAAANCSTNGTSVAIGANHGHSVTVPKEDVVAGTDKTYTLSGGGHTHSVTVTAANFTSLKSNTMVVLTSSNDGHTHSVTITCA